MTGASDSCDVAPSTPLCAACGDVNPLGLAICPRCAALARSGRPTLVLLRKPDQRERSDLLNCVDGLLGSVVDPAGARAVVSGERALFRVPASVAHPIVEALASRGVPAEAVAAARAWTLLPAHFFLLLGAILLVGFIAAAVAVPMFAWTSPLMVVLLLWSAQSSTARPLVRPARLRGAATLLGPAIDTLTLLDAERPRALLADLLSIARPLLGEAQTSRDLARIVGELLNAAAATAREVDRLERLHTTLEQHFLLDGGGADVRVASLVCDRARRAGTSRLQSAIAALGQLASASGDDAAAAGERLTELTRTLGLESEARAGAARDVEAMLRPESRRGMPAG